MPYVIKFCQLPSQDPRIATGTRASSPTKTDIQDTRIAEKTVECWVTTPFNQYKLINCTVYLACLEKLPYVKVIGQQEPAFCDTPVLISPVGDNDNMILQIVLCYGWWSRGQLSVGW